MASGTKVTLKILTIHADEISHGKQKIWKGNDLNFNVFAGQSTPQI